MFLESRLWFGKMKKKKYFLPEDVEGIGSPWTDWFEPLDIGIRLWNLAALDRDERLASFDFMVDRCFISVLATMARFLVLAILIMVYFKI